MVRFVIILFIKYSMFFKKRFAKKDNNAHILIGDFWVDLQLYPHSELWRLCIKNITAGEYFILSKQGKKQFKAEYADFITKVINNDKSLLGFR